MKEFNAVHSTVVSRIFDYHLSVIYFIVLSNFLVFYLDEYIFDLSSFYHDYLVEILFYNPLNEISQIVLSIAHL